MIVRSIRSRLSRRLRICAGNHRNHGSLSSDVNQENLLSLLQSCEKISQTVQIHGAMLKNGLDTIPFPVSKLLAQICKQDMEYAVSVFRKIEIPNLFMFNSMLRGYSDSNDPREGLVLFNCMRAQNHIQDFSLDQFTFISVLKSCSRLVEISAAIGVHAVALKSGFVLFLNVNNALLNSYCVCGRIQDAHQVFDEMGETRDIVSWNSLMWGYLCVAQYDLVIDLFKKLYVDSPAVSVTTILSVLQASGEIRNASFRDVLHAFCFKVGFLSEVKINTALISMYGKQGLIDSARQVFDEIDDARKDVVLWNCLIDAYANCSHLEAALELLKLMRHNGVQPNSSTLSGLLSACSASGAISAGQYVCDFVEENHLVLDAVLGTALVDMYAKSGLLEKAIAIFEGMDCKDVKSWTAMISGYGLHGQADHAVMLFRRMENEGYTPNEVTFLSLLNSCSHGGLVSEAIWCLRRMVDVYRLMPKIEHYGCVIDLLGRAGMLEEAHNVINELPVAARDGTAWRTLLGACRVYGNVNLAERVIEELEQTDGEHAADLLALRGTYAVAGIPHGTDFVESVKKEAGWSTVQYLK